MNFEASDRIKFAASATKDAQDWAKAITEPASGVYDVSTIEKTVNVTLSASFKTK